MNKNIFFISLLTGLVLIPLGVDSSLAIAISTYTIIDLFTYNENEIPVIQYMAFIFSMNFLLVPFILYQFGINNYILDAYQLRISQEQLFSYLIPCMAALILGLNLFGTKKFQIINLNSIKAFVDLRPNVPKYLMIIGIIGYFMHDFVPSELEYIFFLLSDMRFAALFLLILSHRKVPVWFYFFSYGLLIVGAVTSSLFNDLLNLLFFLGFILNTRYKPKWPVKLAAVIGIFFLIYSIQSIKSLLRSQIKGEILNDFSVLNNSIDEATEINASLSIEEQLANTLLRLNQAWVTSSSIEYYENNGFELQKGNHLAVILEAVLLPRFLDPDKITSGDRSTFNQFSGHFVDEGTSIALGAPTDGFVDWGYWGWIFMFFYGLVFSLCLRFLYGRAKIYPVLFAFLPVIFYYAVRPDCEIQTTLANIFKATLGIYGFLILYNRWQTIKVGKIRITQMPDNNIS